MARAKERGYNNLEVCKLHWSIVVFATDGFVYPQIITADVNTFDFDSRKYVNNPFPTPAMLELREYRFDRILSIEVRPFTHDHSVVVYPNISRSDVRTHEKLLVPPA